MKIWTVLITTFVLINLVSCSSKQTRPADSSEVGDEVSLKEDRQKMAELRKDVPAEKRVENDRLADMLKRWQEVKMNPDDLRDKFDNEIRKSRAQFEKRIKKKRDDFNDKLKEEREAFREKQKGEREDFNGSKVTSEKRSAFYDKQDDKRRKFDSDLQERRSDFEDDIREERKNFDDEISNLRSEFRTEFPAYRKRYEEFMKEKEAEKEARAQGVTSGRPAAPTSNAPQVAATPTDGPTSDLSEFDEIQRRRRQKLQPGSDGQ